MMTWTMINLGILAINGLMLMGVVNRVTEIRLAQRVLKETVRRRRGL